MKKSIVITGASKGIGYATAKLLHQQGWDVLGIARKAPETFPGSFIECDLASLQETEALAATLAKNRSIVGIVNNFGMARHERIGEVDYADFHTIMDMNIRPALLLTQAILPTMREIRFGRIVNVSSLVTKGLPYRTSYAAAKAAIESITKTMAIELSNEGITANVVAPGPTETELFRQNNPLGSEGEARYLAQIPMGRLATPDEIAAAIAFFTSAAAGFITGQTLFVDGGASLGSSASH